jgi:hypothetical protein
MTERERLIELISEAKDIYPTIPLVNACKPEFKYFLADHLLANGVLCPPCKAWDTVYRIVKLLNDETKIVEGEVLEIAISHEHHGGNECHFYFWAKGEEFTRRHYSIWCDFVDFGKTVFLSREEAEKALAERSRK